MDLHHLKQTVTFALQFILFFFLFTIGVVCGLIYMNDDCVPNACYFSTYARLAKLEKTSADNCSNLTDPLCSRQMRVDVYFFKVKMLIIYYSSIIISMVYTWHRTVRLLSSFFVLFVITVIVFGTDLILCFDQAVYVSTMVCLSLMVLFPSLMAYLAQNAEDPLSLLCGHNILSDNLYEFLLNDTSKRPRLYRWAKKMKQQWNIKEEKLIISIIAIIIISIVGTIVPVYVLPLYSL
jgi:hypothetical protein